MFSIPLAVLLLVQKKLSLHLTADGGKPRLTLVNYPTGFILKPQTEQYEKTIDAFNEVLTQSEIEAFELGFTLAARLMIDVLQSAELPDIDEA